MKSLAPPEAEVSGIRLSKVRLDHIYPGVQERLREFVENPDRRPPDLVILGFSLHYIRNLDLTWEHAFNWFSKEVKDLKPVRGDRMKIF